MKERSNLAYLRVSTDEQRPENQRKDIEKIAPDGTEFLTEHGSAWKHDGLKHRPVFQGIYESVKRGHVGKLYVWDLDRLYRKRKQLVAFLKLCKARGTVVLSYRQKYLSEIEKAPEPWNEIIYDLIIQILAAIAEEESQKKSDRIRAAHQNHDRDDWGRPRAKFNERRAYHLLMTEGKSLQEVADEVGVSKATIYRFKKVCEKNPPSFINKREGSERDDSVPQ